MWVHTSVFPDWHYFLPILNRKIAALLQHFFFFCSFPQEIIIKRLPDPKPKEVNAQSEAWVKYSSQSKASIHGGF